MDRDHPLYDLLRERSDAEMAEVQPVSQRTIDEALQQGQTDRESIERHARHAQVINPSLRFR
jgi:hypothetical protein